MPDEAFITVRGEARIEVEPEIAVLGVTMAARDKDRQRAVELLAARTREVGDLIRGAGEAVERLDSHPVLVQPVLRESELRGTRYGSGRGVVGYLAQSGFTVTVADFAVLGDLVFALATQELVTLVGPSWRLRPDSPAHREVRLAAVRDSTRRARDYAEAFGARITGMVEAADTGLLAGNVGPGGHVASPAAMLRSAGEGYAEHSDIDLVPAKQSLYAQVEARFKMSQPDLGR